MNEISQYYTLSIFPMFPLPPLLPPGPTEGPVIVAAVPQEATSCVTVAGRVGVQPVIGQQGLHHTPATPPVLATGVLGPTCWTGGGSRDPPWSTGWGRRPGQEGGRGGQPGAGGAPAAPPGEAPAQSILVIC